VQIEDDPIWATDWSLNPFTGKTRGDQSGPVYRGVHARKARIPFDLYQP
jgi:hypothetical protein